MCRLLLANKSGILKLHSALKNYEPEKRQPYKANRYFYGYWDKGTYYYPDAWDDGITTTRRKVASYWDRDDANTIQYPDGIKTLLNYLEISLGGDGNGLTLVRDETGNDTLTLKGTEVDNDILADMLLREKYRWAVWHTRLKSSGDVRDSNCHPYEFTSRTRKNRERLILAMNGTENAFSFGRFWNSRTDTEAIGHIVLKLHLKIPYVFQHFNSVFVGVYNGKPFAVRNSGALRYFQDKEGIVFASELPRTISEPLDQDAIWIDGKLHMPRRSTPPAKKTTLALADIQQQITQATANNPDMKDWTEAEKVLYVTDGITPYTKKKSEEKESK